MPKEAPDTLRKERERNPHAWMNIPVYVSNPSSLMPRNPQSEQEKFEGGGGSGPPHQTKEGGKKSESPSFTIPLFFPQKKALYYVRHDDGATNPFEYPLKGQIRGKKCVGEGE